jgi:hypothetical protein
MGSRDRSAPEVEVIALSMIFARLDRRLGRARMGEGHDASFFPRAGVPILIVSANNRLNDRHARCNACSGVTRQDDQAQAKSNEINGRPQ